MNKTENEEEEKVLIKPKKCEPKKNKELREQVDKKKIVKNFSEVLFLRIEEKKYIHLVKYY